MKKTLIKASVILTSLGFAGCQSEQFVPEKSQPDDAIVIRADTPLASRAAESYCANNLPPSFTLWAKTSVDAPEPDLIYFRDKTLVRTDAGYAFENGTPFWPKEGNLDFFAFRSDEGCFNRSVHNPKFENYVIKDDVTEQLDLLYGVTRNAAREDGPVQLNMRHALSQIVFRAKVSNPSIEVVIHDVSIAGKLYNKGTFTFPTETETVTNWLDASHNDDPETIYPDDLGLGVWDEYETTPDFPGEYTAVTDATPINTESGVHILTQSPETHGNEGWEQVMTLLPQHQEAFSPDASKHATGTYLKVNCTITNVPAEEGDAKVVVHEGYANIPLEIDWQQGVRYVYTLNFGSDKATSIGDFYPIEIDCSVDDFLPYEDPAVRHGTVTINYWTNDGETCFKSIDFVKDITNPTITLPTSVPKELLGEVKSISGWSTEPNTEEPEFFAGTQFRVDFSKEEINLYLNTGFLYTVNYYEWVEDEEFDDNGTGGHYEISEKYPPLMFHSSEPEYTYNLPSHPSYMVPDHLSRFNGHEMYLMGVNWSIPGFSPNYSSGWGYGNYPSVQWCGWAKENQLDQHGITSYTISSDDPVLNLYSVWRYYFALHVWLYSSEATCYTNLGYPARILKTDYNTTSYTYIENEQGAYLQPDWGKWWWQSTRILWPGCDPINGIAVIGLSKEKLDPTYAHPLSDCDYTFNDPIILHPYIGYDIPVLLYAVFGNEADFDLYFE